MLQKILESLNIVPNVRSIVVSIPCVLNLGSGETDSWLSEADIFAFL